MTNFAPEDDPVIPCEVRLWYGKDIVVFVHPSEWKKVSITGGTPMVVSFHDVTFPCRISGGAEFYSFGTPKTVVPSDFGVPTHGDYPATARIDWPLAIPDILRTGLEQTSELAAGWQSLPCQEIRKQLSTIFRARRPDEIANRQLALLRQLGK